MTAMNVRTCSFQWLYYWLNLLPTLGFPLSIYHLLLSSILYICIFYYYFVLVFIRFFCISKMPLTDVLSSLGDNPYFGAGFGLFGIGLGAALLRKSASTGLILFRRNFMMTLEVPCRDKSYQWVLLWVTQKAARRTQHLSVETTFEQMDTGRVNTTYHFLPSIGVHLIE